MISEHLHVTVHGMYNRHTNLFCRNSLVLLLDRKSFKESCGEAGCPLQKCTWEVSVSVFVLFSVVYTTTGRGRTSRNDVLFIEAHVILLTYTIQGVFLGL